MPPTMSTWYDSTCSVLTEVISAYATIQTTSSAATTEMYNYAITWTSLDGGGTGSTSWVTTAAGNAYDRVTQRLERDWRRYQARAETRMRAQIQPALPIPPPAIVADVRSVAIGRAKRLLVANLTPDQRRTLDANGYFDVQKGLGVFYRICLGRSANVIKYVNNKPVTALCCHPRLYVPDEDTMLAQKFMIEYDEAGFLRLANRHPLDGGYAQHYLAQIEIPAEADDRQLAVA